MHKSRLYILLFLIIIFLCSCEKIIFKNDPENNPIENFEYLWNQMNEKYAFFDVKKVDWDSIYKIYRPRVNNQINNDELFNIMGGMMNELKDGHVNLISSFNVSRYDITLLGEQNINLRLIKEKYLKEDYYSTGSFNHNFIENGRVGYIRYSSFGDSHIKDYELDFIFERYKDTDGLIIDIRQNGGGYVTNVFKLISRFSSGNVVLYRTQIKSGEGKDDFTELEEVSATNNNKLKYLGKVAVLTDRGTFSAASFFAVCTYAYDNIFLIGDTTGGGLGLPNGGQLPNGWTYRFSITRTIAVDGNNYENGVPPDYTVILSEESVRAGIDDVIETAVNKILK